MIVDFTFSNIGPFKTPTTLMFEAATSTHLAPAYVRDVPLANGRSIKLLRMALLYGANAAGKSTVLEALSLLDDLVTNPATDTETEIEVNPFAFQPQAEAQPTNLQIKFIRAGVIYRYELSFTKAGILSETLMYQRTPPNGTAFDLVFSRCRGDARNQFVIEYGKEHQLNKSQQEKLAAELLPNSTMLSALNRKMSLSDEKIVQAYAWFKEQLMAEVTPKTMLTPWVNRGLESGFLNKGTLLKMLNQAGVPIQNVELIDKKLTINEQKIIDNASDDETKERMLGIFRKHKEVKTVYQVGQLNYSLSLNRQESLGTQRYYGLTGLLSGLCQGSQTESDAIQACKILPIDEIEHSLHPDLLEYFMVTFLNDSGNSQLIATTHYREFLQNELLFRNDVIWFVDKDAETLTSTLYCLEDVRADAGLRPTSSVYNFYKQGRLGAVPKLQG
jgi:AAA15 family ATPase/GTPase